MSAPTDTCRYCGLTAERHVYPEGDCVAAFPPRSWCPGPTYDEVVAERDQALLESARHAISAAQQAEKNAALRAEVDHLRALVAARDVCVVCGNVLLPAPEPHCQGCDTEGPRYTDPE